MAALTRPDANQEYNVEKMDERRKSTNLNNNPRIINDCVDASTRKSQARF